MDLLEQYKNYLMIKGKSENTIKTYLIQVRSFIKYLQLDIKEFSKLNRENILDYLSYMKIRSANPRTINVKLSCLLEFNRFLVENGIQTEVIISKNDFYRIQQNILSPDVISEEEVTAFRNRILDRKNPRKNEKDDAYYKFRNKRDFCIVTILAYGGVRIAECLSLKIHNVAVKDKNNNIIINEDIVVYAGKGMKYRTVPVHYKVKNALEEYLKLIDSDRVYLFYSRESEKLDSTTINKIFKELGKGITPHQLRHFMISNMLNKAHMTIPEAQAISGHSDPRTLMLYTHPSRKDIKNKINQI